MRRSGMLLTASEASLIIEPGGLTTFDDFVLPNFTPLGVSSSGHTWDIRSGSFYIISNRAYGYGPVDLKIATIDHESPNGVYSAVSPDGPGGLSNENVWGVTLRYVDIDNWLAAYVYRQGSGSYLHQLFIVKNVAGVRTIIDGPTTLTWVENLQLIATLSGTDLEVVANDVTRNITVPANPLGNHHGLFADTYYQMGTDTWSGIGG